MVKNTYMPNFKMIAAVMRVRCVFELSNASPANFVISCWRVMRRTCRYYDHDYEVPTFPTVPIICLYRMHAPDFHIKTSLAFIHEEVAEEAVLIFLRDVHIYLAMWNTADVTGGKPIAV
jgi:hypothetical protein